MTRSALAHHGNWLPLDHLIGRPVLDPDGRSAGRIQELRVNGDWIVTEYVLGMGGLLERLNVGVRLLLGAAVGASTARAGQIDISDPTRPRLKCRRDELGYT